MTELALCILALLLGPVAYHMSRARRTTYAFFDGFVLVGVAGLVLFEILPNTISGLGFTAVPVAIFGFFFPHAIEHRLGSVPVSPRTILRSLIILGLIIHQLLDGAALEVPDPDGHGSAPSALAMAVILHQLPKGFLLWDIARKAGGSKAAVLVIGGLIIATSAGFFAGAGILDLFASSWVLGFQAFVAGGLLHVVVHHVSGGAGGPPHSHVVLSSGAGALVALGLLVWAPDAHLEAETASFRSVLFHLWIESAAPILLGFLAAGLLQSFVPVNSFKWFQKGNPFTQALRGVAIGLPLPICSCGVTPIYHTLIRRGAPPAAAVAFLIATPEIGLDSFFLSLRLLGLKITLIRVSMAFVIAIATSCILSRLFRHVLPDPAGAPLDDVGKGEEHRTFARKLEHALRFGFGDLVDHLGAWLVAGIVIAAALEPWVQPEWFSSLPPGLDVILLALAGLPIYVCASSATPLAAVLLSKGVSVGAVLALLITGPATNVTTLGILGRIHGLGRAVLLPVTVLVLSVVSGFAVNGLLDGKAGPVVFNLAGREETYFAKACGVVLAGFIALSILRLGPRRFLGKMGSEYMLGLPADEEAGSAGGESGHSHGHTHHAHTDGKE